MRFMNKNKRWGFIIIGIIIMMLLGTVYSYSVFRAPLESYMKIGSTESGLPYMFALAFYALFMLVGGKYIEKFRPRTLIIFGGCLVAIGWILASFSTGIILLTLSYGCISGAGVGIVYGAIMNVIAKWFPDKKGIAVGLVLVGFGLSPLVMAPVAEMLVDNLGIMKAFLILGIAFGVLIPVLGFLFKSPQKGDLELQNEIDNRNQITTEISLKEMIRTKSFKGIYFNFMIGTMIGLMMIGMTLNIGIDYFSINKITVVSLMAVFAIFNGVGRPVLGWVTDHFGTKKAMILSYTLIMSASFILIFFNKSIIGFLVAFSIYWFNVGGWLAIAPTSTLKLYGLKNYSQNYGLVFTAYGIGAILGVSSSGIMLDLWGNYIYVFCYIIGLCIIGLGLTFKCVEKIKNN